MGSKMMLLWTAAIGLSALPVFADEMPYQGTTSGSFSDSATASVLGFTGTSFGPGLTSGGSATLSNLGTFTITLAPSGSVNLGGNFNLTVTFSIPAGNNLSNPITAAVSGTINTQNANNVFVNFGAGQNVTFNNPDGSGSFLLTINDVTFSPNPAQGGATKTLTGQISNAVFTRAGNAPPTTPVPEPTSITLLSSATLAAGVVLYRRHRRG